MDQLANYRTLIKQILLRNAEYAPSLAACRRDRFWSSTCPTEDAHSAKYITWRSTSSPKIGQNRDGEPYSDRLLGEIDSIPVFDERSDQYFLVDFGWNRTGRVHSVILHLQIKNGKVWIERDGTEEGIAYDLLEAGIPKEDIVFAFYRPERRAITEFAIA